MLAHAFELPNRGPLCVCGHHRIFHEERMAVIDGAPCTVSRSDDPLEGACIPWPQDTFPDGKTVWLMPDGIFAHPVECACGRFVEECWNGKRALTKFAWWAALPLLLVLGFDVLAWLQDSYHRFQGAWYLNALLVGVPLGIVVVASYNAGHSAATKHLLTNFRSKPPAEPEDAPEDAEEE